MRHAELLAVVITGAASLFHHSTVRGQAPAPSSTFIAFRSDSTHVVATLKITDDPRGDQQVTAGLSAEPAARLGYQYFDLPAWGEQYAGGVRAGDRFVIHAASGQLFQAETERLVGGTAGCESAIGVLLRVAPEQAKAFGALPAKYFLAERSTLTQTSNPAPRSVVGTADSPSSESFRRALTSALDSLFLRELPNVMAESAPHIARMAASTAAYQRNWARQRQSIDDALQKGRGELKYDIQSFRLGPDGVPLHFVRAQWMVGRRQGFAASVWLRGEERLDVVQTDLRAARWLRYPEFQSIVRPENFGLILNVFDRDRDGWGEVLLAVGGYEGMSLSLLEYSPAGFQPTGTEYGYGC